MKHMITKLSFLIVTMSVLTSLREDSGINKANQSFNEEQTFTCKHTRNDFANNISCKQAPVVPDKKADTHIQPVADNEVSLSPISRFILLQ